LAVPASVDSIPTSGTTEDHVSMGWHAGLKALRAVDAASRVVGVEALCAAQALDYRGLPSAVGLAAVRTRLRREIEEMRRDRFLAPDIETAGRLVREGALVSAAEAEVGELA